MLGCLLSSSTERAARAERSPLWRGTSSQHALIPSSLLPALAFFGLLTTLQLLLPVEPSSGQAAPSAVGPHSQLQSPGGSLYACSSFMPMCTVVLTWRSSSSSCGKSVTRVHVFIHLLTSQQQPGEEHRCSHLYFWRQEV